MLYQILGHVNHSDSSLVCKRFHNLNQDRNSHAIINKTYAYHEDKSTNFDRRQLQVLARSGCSRIERVCLLFENIYLRGKICGITIDREEKSSAKYLELAEQLQNLPIQMEKDVQEAMNRVGKILDNADQALRINGMCFLSFGRQYNEAISVLKRDIDKLFGIRDHDATLRRHCEEVDYVRNGDDFEIRLNYTIIITEE